MLIATHSLIDTLCSITVRGVGPRRAFLDDASVACRYEEMHKISQEVTNNEKANANAGLRVGILIGTVGLTLAAATVVAVQQGGAAS